MSEQTSSAICLVRRGASRAEEIPPERFDTIDVIRSDPTAIVWMALRNPDPAMLAILPDEFGVHHLALEDVRKRGQRPKIDSYREQHMIVLFEALERQSDEELPLAELHVFFGDRWLVTVDWHASSAVAAARAGRAQPSRDPRATGRATWRSRHDVSAGSANG